MKALKILVAAVGCLFVALMLSIFLNIIFLKERLAFAFTTGMVTGICIFISVCRSILHGKS